MIKYKKLSLFNKFSSFCALTHVMMPFRTKDQKDPFCASYNELKIAKNSEKTKTHIFYVKSLVAIGPNHVKVNCVNEF